MATGNRQLATLLFSSDYLLPLFSESRDAEPDDAAGAQIYRRLHAVADSGRRAGRDDVAGVQAHELAQVAHEVRHAEHHRLGRAVLVALAVNLEPHLELVIVGDFVGRDQPGADRAERVGALALDPLSRALELKCPFRDVVDG